MKVRKTQLEMTPGSAPIKNVNKWNPQGRFHTAWHVMMTRKEGRHGRLQQTQPNRKKQSEGTPANRKYKDKLFRFLFGNEEYKEYALSLYNAVNGTHYDNVDDLTLISLEDFLYLGMRNDVSILIHWDLSLYEHQSTWNPNMPLRGLFYFSRILAKYIIQKVTGLSAEEICSC